LIALPPAHCGGRGLASIGLDFTTPDCCGFPANGECRPAGTRRAALVALPDAPEIPGGGKAGEFGDTLDRQVAVGKQFAGARDAQALLVADHADAGVLGEKAAEMPFADVRAPGQFCERPGPNRILSDCVLRAMNRRVQVIAVRQPRRELRVVAAAALIDDQAAGDPGGEFAAGVASAPEQMLATRLSACRTRRSQATTACASGRL